MADSSLDPELLDFLSKSGGSSGTEDPSKLLIKARSFLGGEPRPIYLPGGGDLSMGVGAAPSPGVGSSVGAGGGQMFGGKADLATGSRIGGESGANILGLIQKSLGIGEKGADFLNRLLSGGDLGPRGTIGGEGTPQNANTSLSDALRSATGGSVSSLPFGAGSSFTTSPDVLSAFQSMSPAEQELFSAFAGPGVFGDNLGTLGNVGGSLSDALRSGAGAAGGATGAAAGSSGLGTGLSGAGALAALLGLIAQETGNADLGKAASALGVGAGAATTGAGIAATAAGEAVAGGALGAAALPIGAAWLPILALTMATGESPDFSDIATGGRVDPWLTFGNRLGLTTGLENQSLNALATGLPRAQSQADLQSLLDTFKSKVGERVGGFGEGSDPFTIPNLPGAGGSMHEGKQVADFGPEVNMLNKIIGQLRGNLPPTDANQFDYASYFNMPGRGLAGSETLMKATMPDGSVQYGTAADFEANKMNFQARTVEALQPGSPEYDQAASAAGLFQPPPVSSAWQQLVAQLQGGAPAAPSELSPEMISMLARGGTTTPTAGPGTPLPDVYWDFLKQQQQAAA